MCTATLYLLNRCHKCSVAICSVALPWSLRSVSGKQRAKSGVLLPQQDGRDVIEVFSLQMPRFFEAILENPKLLRVVGTLFGSPSVGRPFAQVCAPAW